jgi:1-phosphatidylinositol-4-phosphate 5-kinase
MITSFINTEQSDHTGLIFVIPQLTIALIIIQVIYDLCCREMFVTDKEVRQAYKTNITYVLVFSLLHVPMLVLIGITSGKSILLEKDANRYLVNYSFFCTVLTSSIPMIIGIIRNCKGFTKIKQVKNLQRKFTKVKTIVGFNSDYNSPFNETEAKTEDQFDWLEKHAMEFFMRDILLGVAHCIHNSKQFGNDKLDLQAKLNEETIKHNITINNFPLKDKDQEVANSKFLNVNIVEYAPKIFAYLRNIEKINLDDMIESFLPKNNKRGISESQGKSGSFFISTDDNRYMVKTLRSDEFELIRHTFLNKFVQYITHNPDSLLVRIYGMYNIILSQGHEMLVIVMRNVIGPFQDNIIAKYDLKGSTLNRKSDFDMEKSDSSTMKDLNFNEYEHGIMISRDHIQKFRKITRSDSTFLCNLELMDYSVFLVKLTLSKDEEIDIFGEEIRKKKDKDYNELILASTLAAGSVMGQTPLTDYEQDDNNLKINEISRNTIKGKGHLIDVNHYEQYIYPSLNPGVAYILSIIDYFQMFNFYKVVESGLKTKFSKNAAGVSCVDPQTYSKRFIKYFETSTDIKKLFKDNNSNDLSNLNEEEESRINNSHSSGESSNIELQTLDS